MDKKLQELGNNEIIILYNNLKNKIKNLEDDIKATEEALTDKKVDYITVREYKNDIIADNLELTTTKRKIKQVVDYALIKNIILEPEEKEVDNKENINPVLKKNY